MLWNDARASAVVDGWQRDGTLDATFEITGCFGSAGLANAQLRWLLRHEPASVQRAETLLSCGSWIYYRLTARRVLEVSDAANPFLAARTGGYDATLLDRYGLAEVKRLLPPLVSGSERIAPLRGDVASELGLRAGTPVALAPYDVVATAIGTGAIDTGQSFTVLGTTLCSGTVSDDPNLTRVPGGMTLPINRPDRWLIAHATMTGTGALDWVASMLAVGGAAELLDLAATAVESPRDRPLLLPYLSPAGERSPFRDPAIRGSWIGLDTTHTRADLARAALDGLTLVVRDCLGALGPISSLAVSGGGARSELWCQSISDATGAAVHCPDTAEVGVRGAVLVGAADAGMFDGLPAAVAAIVHPRHTHLPEPAARERFEADYQRFRANRHVHGNAGDPGSG